MLAPIILNTQTTVKYYGSKLGNEFTNPPLPYCSNMGNLRGSATIRPSVNTPSGLRYDPPLGVSYAVGFDGLTARAQFEGV